MVTQIPEFKIGIEFFGLKSINKLLEETANLFQKIEIPLSKEIVKDIIKTKEELIKAKDKGWDISQITFPGEGSLAHISRDFKDSLINPLSPKMRITMAQKELHIESLYTDSKGKNLVETYQKGEVVTFDPEKTGMFKRIRLKKIDLMKITDTQQNKIKDIVDKEITIRLNEIKKKYTLQSEQKDL